MRIEDLENLRSRRLCYRCVAEDFLSAEIRNCGKRGKCSYCGLVGKSQCLDVLSERVGAAFLTHFVRTSDQPTDYELALMRDGESGDAWERRGEPVIEAIMDAVEIPHKAASNLQCILETDYGYVDSENIGEETEFSSGSYYEEKGSSGNSWWEQWHNFERSIKEESRYFNKFATDHLSAVFDGIDKLSAGADQNLVIEAGPGTNNPVFFRARAFQSNESLKEALKRPDLHLGPPPSLLATAGRMNARGISVFYGSNDPHVALAEVRPPVGSQVAVACFVITRPIRLLDLTALSEVKVMGSIFDPTYTRELERATFLRSLSHRITKAVMPDDEPFAYIATQTVSDFLATNCQVPIDGILFPSAQTGGRAQNVVLFHKASRVQPMSLPLGVEIDVSLWTSTEDGPEPDYTVTEKLRPQRKGKFSGASSDDAMGYSKLLKHQQLKIDSDEREVTLNLLADSVRVHVVTEVRFQAEEHTVNRYRFKISRTPKF